jgi:hypothetical protein
MKTFISEFDCGKALTIFPQENCEVTFIRKNTENFITVFKDWNPKPFKIVSLEEFRENMTGFLDKNLLEGFLK